MTLLGLAAVAALGLAACQKKTDTAQTGSGGAMTTTATVPAVCLLDNVGLWGTPTAEKGVGQLGGTISLGEVVTLTGENQMGKDYNGQEHKFYKVKTSVDDEGWVQELFFAMDARPAVIVKETLRYQRDSATASFGTEKVPPMTVAALVEEKGDWVRVQFGGRKDAPFLSNYAAKDFWVKKDTLSVSEEDVTVAVLALRALSMDDLNGRADALQAIVDDGAYGASEFIPALRDELAKAKGEDEIQVNVNVN
jgi:hypothetical protein